jgi:hypothetical protein
MKVSRQTFGRILGAARRKVAEALVLGHALRIEGGSVSDAPRRARCPYCSHPCRATAGPAACASCAPTLVKLGAPRRRS